MISKFLRINTSSSEFPFFSNINNLYQLKHPRRNLKSNNKKLTQYTPVIILKIMENILEELQKKKCWKSFLKTQCRRNKINPQLANTFTIVKIRKFYEKLMTMEPTNKSRMKSSVWLENELKAYQWFIVALSGCRGTLIQNYMEKEWKYLSNIFNKEQSILEYEAVRLINERTAVKKKWQEEQTHLLQKIIKQDPVNNKWNEIARQLFQTSQKRYFRTGKQCRERWFNHLDPEKKHGQWESTEDRKMVEFILGRGKKWSEIVKTLQNHRTEHMIKNRFKTLTIRLNKKYQQDHLTENQMLRKFMNEKEENGEMEQGQAYIEQEEEEDNENEVEEKKKDQLEVEGLPVIESQQEGGEFDDNDNENADKYPSYRECQIQQVVTPCPIIYQTFTPTFLNTPNSLTFLMNYSFDQFEKNQNLFLKNN